MGERVKCKAIVLAEATYGEGSKMLTALSDEFGRISIAAKGAKSAKSRFLAASQQFCYSSMELSTGRNGIYTLCEADLINSFYGLRENVDALFLASDIASAVLKVSREEDRDEELLRLTLNTFYFLAQTENAERLTLAKDIFRIRISYDQGFFAVPESVRYKGTAQAVEHIVCSDFKTLFSFNVSPEVLEELDRIAQRAYDSMFD